MALPANRKIVVLGSGGVGKTAWLRRLAGEAFPRKYDTTYGCVGVRGIDVSGTLVDIYEVAGQEMFTTQRPEYFRNAVGAVIMISCSNYKMSYKRALSEAATFRALRPGAPVVFVANKSELRRAGVDEEQMLLMSARENQNVWAPLRALLAQLA